LDDDWRHEVIALAAGVPGCDPGDIIRALLRKKDWGSIVIAAKCIETAINVPLDLRTKVDNALEGILPPKDWDDVIGLLEIGRTVAPILARGLAGYHLSGMVYSLDFFRISNTSP
jgi:hypothetical protein